jgi:hypothetical protein
MDFAAAQLQELADVNSRARARGVRFQAERKRVRINSLQCRPPLIELDQPDLQVL